MKKSFSFKEREALLTASLIIDRACVLSVSAPKHGRTITIRLEGGYKVKFYYGGYQSAQVIGARVQTWVPIIGPDGDYLVPHTYYAGARQLRRNGVAGGNGCLYRHTFSERMNYLW